MNYTKIPVTILTYGLNHCNESFVDSRKLNRSYCSVEKKYAINTESCIFIESLNAQSRKLNYKRNGGIFIVMEFEVIMGRIYIGEKNNHQI